MWNRRSSSPSWKRTLNVSTKYLVQDLNRGPNLPFEENSFDATTYVVSIDYLTKPLDVSKEISRELKPGGQAIMSFSSRCFWTKAISIWTSIGDTDHFLIVGAYSHYTGGFERPQVSDLSNSGPQKAISALFKRMSSSAG
ncbi:hypothetical protein MLD38_006566 [Melastoma candidum]|uniref:Uncharacterized protein n=1 Tax=Melastoma candidum TaxID=119954 RepID=A0ACB9RMY7_9MYRT|nr:hypothetical protein MLD38_006566 [Melastoma candidum]